MAMRRAILLFLVLLASCSDATDPEPVEIPPLQWTTVATDFQQPVMATAPPGSPLTYVVELGGRVWILEDGQRLDVPFLDLSSTVAFSPEFGRGLLGFAFHPDGRDVFAYFASPHPDGGWRTSLVRYPVSADGLSADAAASETLLDIRQPAGDHNGGDVFFGADGMLYLTTGDGGSGDGATRANAQYLSRLLGKLLRLDVSERPYRVPADNPFADMAGMRGEIWAYGFRHPWRAASDPTSGSIIVGDVGEHVWEELNVVGRSGGDNFGWPLMEGPECFEGRSCDPAQYTLPEVSYDHDDGCSVGAGVFYRGGIPGLAGHFFYTDYCAGWIRSARLEDGRMVDHREWPELGFDGHHVTSFGEDGRGEVLVVTQEGGVHRLEPVGS